MNILFLAPQPFYQERGTPIAIRLALTVLCAAGHKVDLLTYHEGADLEIQGMRTFRIAKPPFASNVPIGFSGKKLLCDVYLSFMLWRLLAKNRYDVIHAVEESIYPSILANVLARKTLLYDMDSSMADQLVERFAPLRHAGKLLYGLERIAVRRSDFVLPVCQALADRVMQHAPGKEMHVLHDVAFDSAEPNTGAAVADLRANLPESSVLALYVGNLEPYQGIDLLLEGMALLDPDDRVELAVIGGNPVDVANYQAKATQLGLAGRTRFLGPKPLADLPHYLVQGDILVSPRLKGNNTPMKVYSYMLSEKPILATDIASHTQVLDSSCAMLVDRRPNAMADGIRALARDPAMRRRLGASAADRARKQYSYAAFRDKLLGVYGELAGTVAARSG